MELNTYLSKEVCIQDSELDTKLNEIPAVDIPYFVKIKAIDKNKIIGKVVYINNTENLEDIRDKFISVKIGKRSGKVYTIEVTYSPESDLNEISQLRSQILKRNMDNRFKNNIKFGFNILQQIIKLFDTATSDLQYSLLNASESRVSKRRKL
jgi:hypothetical protein